MILYLGMAVILYFLAIYCSTKELKTNVGVIGIGKTALFLFILTTIILGGIRWETGTDWKTYHDYFYVRRTWKEYSSYRFEIGYVFINFFVRRYFGSYTILLLIMSFIIILLQYKTIKTIALYPVLSYYFFFCDNIGGMFPVRLNIGMAIALTSIYFIHKKNKVAFIAITGIAIAFHRALLLWLISYPLYHKKISSRMIVIFFIIATIIGMFGTGIFIYIVDVTLVRFGIPGPIATIIKGYILGSYSDGSFSIFRMLLSMAKRVIFVFIFLYLRRKISEQYVYADGLINVYLVANIIYSLFAFREAFAPMARMITPFLFIEVLLLPVILKIYKKTSTKYILLLLFFLYGLMKLNSAISGYSDMYIPYRSILS